MRRSRKSSPSGLSDGVIPPRSAASLYLAAHGIDPARLDTYIARRANHEVMVRGTFANPRLQNELAPGRPGGVTRRMPAGEEATVFDAARAYGADGVPTVVIAGRNYGCGSSRDWAAKGTRLLGIRAVIAESFERIHRSNLVGMGVLPLEFPAGTGRKTLALTGAETFDLTGLAAGFGPGATVLATIRRPDGSTLAMPLRCRVDTAREAMWVRHGGILPYVTRAILAAQPAGAAEPAPRVNETAGETAGRMCRCPPRTSTCSRTWSASCSGFRPGRSTTPPPAGERGRAEGGRTPGVLGLHRHHHGRAVLPCASSGRPGGRQATCQPVFHAVQYLLGNQTLDKLQRFGGAQSYPSRTKDTDDVDFSTGSVGLGVAQTLFSSLVPGSDRLVAIAPARWA